jgi:chemotaxis protein MotA
MVVGGGLTVVLTSVPLKFFFKLPKVVMKIFFNKPEHVSEMIEQLVSLAEMARKDGLLAMENKVRDLKNPFMVMGIQMAVDGTPAEVIGDIMRTEIEAVGGRHKECKKMLDVMGRCGPAFGMIATLLGLILMLGNLDDPDAIGPSMAMALVGTLYGAVMANMVCIPMAEKLAFLSHEEILVKEIILRGVLGIQAGDNPRVIEQKLNTYLPPKQRKGAHEEAA